MRIGVPKESRPGERLVAATPATVAQLAKLGYEVVVEHGAGAAASFPDAAYAEAGAALADTAEVWASDVVTAVNAPGEAEIAALTPGATVVSMMAPAAHPELVEALAARGVSALALDAVPRISRAQALDVLSTMSNVAGYRAVIEAAEEFGGMFTGQVTAAGKTPPATVFVIGAGVAGLAAIGAAGSLGAQVRAYDVRPEVGEQIESMGASFVQAQAAQQEVSSDGYASALTAEQERLTAEMYAAETAKADIVVTTALVRGTAPRTISAEMVAAMRPGSVIVDLAASGGGNCELTVPGEKVVTDNGVTILGYTDLTSRMARHTSQLFGTNVVNLLKLLTPGKDGALVLDLDDVVQRGMTVTRAGEVMWPPPPVQVSAAPAADAAPAVAPVDPAEKARLAREAAARKGQRQMVGLALGAVLLALAITFSPAAFLGHFTVFVLAVFVGYYVISNVSHSLHTPLMAQTNAISGIILVGALLQIGSDSWVVSALAFAAAAVASINIFGGFLVAYRMIGMFRKEEA
ncbi:Re/Si-specific NAD(P)(+) transhydrogenase subunit alpha [Cellulomonas hominis]|uniref:proton-translocating NAD(P)(+) transhydrogenase n=1 Tax=Cellulomonas hominis TaxID=156981 RepID=A0A511F954_9CELL|nr:Re/Si-specific NAD(P)(+) transhydrogenase subunit alpha [Cellulomonas hominis]MBB5471976.1 NAD(P) transhydrogenase subunit alpha [Cellulomonas hominis]MBU5423324.1 Re/Si-specific NAD(P)(+) transhydrogenase subunit alpha [Cellulomonas hominis]NKY06917.1 Re/Si-specific NAD(P)(+) transhydrogenase subunit alpha [Cellulomonas hominis]NKY09185.1 Re/Si-specific NAD(P)(+) transhydrogenase subunit alpha [Cellulomonas hominis]GEL45816.1 NAD(P) transhydrogenase subunit alpha [Cellulomonas hominis]